MQSNRQSTYRIQIIQIIIADRMTILTLDSAVFQIIPNVFDVMSNNFRCTDRLSDLFIFRKSHKTAPLKSEQNF